jgi:outer membrane immunogenic protein
MTGMKHAGRAAALVVALAITAGPASAGPPAQFGGGYIGLNAGGASGSSHFSTDPGCPDNTIAAVFCNFNDATSANGTAVSNSGSGRHAPSGFTGGVQGGYNWQSGALVYGGEADIGAFDLSRTVTANGVFPSPFAGTNYTLVDSVSAQWLATLRGRIGFIATPYLLLYGTGGIAFTDIKVSSNYTDNAINPGLNPGGTGYGSGSDFKVGWTLGAGGEWRLAECWSLKGEYLYVDFGSASAAVPTTNSPAFAQTQEFKADLSAQIARIGLNYFLN